jgi:hypothetical protein
MINLMLLLTLSFSTLLFLLLYMLQIKKNRAILASTLSLLVMQNSPSTQSKTDKQQADEAFLKFVSDSRDWAYEYIENVQASLTKFVSDAGPAIDYWDEYGSAMSTPLDQGMGKISKAYKELIALLPEDYGRINT